MHIRTVDFPDELYSPQPLGSDAVVGLLGTHPSEHLAAFSLDGVCLWNHHLAEPHRLGTVSHDECWLIGRNGVVAYALNGAQVRAFDLQLQRRERIGALHRTDDGLLLSIYRTKADKHVGMTPRVVRSSLGGEVSWSTTLPVDQIAYKGCEYMGVATNWEARPMPPWQPEAWLPYGDDQLLVSGNRLLASFQEMPRSGIGCRYVLDSVSGALIWKSPATPIANAHALGNGCFLIGDQGYGAFETHCYEEDDAPLRKWKTHGHFTAFADKRLVCLEMSNDLSVLQYIVELLGDETTRRLSPRLDGYYSSKPVLAEDASLFFWRADRLWNWSDDRGLRSLHSIGFGDGSYASSLVFSPTRFGLNVRGPHRKNGNDRLFAVFER